jgi:hypothetical protein
VTFASTIRDFDIIVSSETHIELIGRANNDHLNNSASPVPIASGVQSVTVTGHALLGDVAIRDAVGGL